MVVVVSVVEVEVEVEVVVRRKKSIAIASLADAVGRAHKVLDVQRGAGRGGVVVVRGRRLSAFGEHQGAERGAGGAVGADGAGQRRGVGADRGGAAGRGGRLRREEEPADGVLASRAARLAPRASCLALSSRAHALALLSPLARTLSLSFRLSRARSRSSFASRAHALALLSPLARTLSLSFRLSRYFFYSSSSFLLRPFSLSPLTLSFSPNLSPSRPRRRHHHHHHPLPPHLVKLDQVVRPHAHLEVARLDVLGDVDARVLLLGVEAGLDGGQGLARDLGERARDKVAVVEERREALGGGGGGRRGRHGLDFGFFLVFAFFRALMRGQKRETRGARWKKCWESKKAAGSRRTQRRRRQRKKTEDALFFRVSSPSQLRRSGTLQHSNVKEIASLDVFRKNTLLGVLDMRPRNF